MSFDPTTLGAPVSREEAQKLQDDSRIDKVNNELHFLVYAVQGSGGDPTLVGRIDVPKQFCTWDKGSCPHGQPTFHQDEQTGWWIHSSCGFPTESWWTAHFQSLVQEE